MTEKPGLTSKEALERRTLFGFNEITEEKSKGVFFLLFDQFKSPLVLILLLACAISIILGEWVESIAIGAIVILNAIIGLLQEYRAEHSILALKKMTAPQARVSRDGKSTLLPARELVPDDLIFLEAGDIVTADAVLVESARLQVNEAILTGESFPVNKEANALEPEATNVYMGTFITRGTASAKVSATGMKTQLGRTAHLIQSAESSPTPLQVQLSQLGKLLMLLCLGVVSLVALISLFQGRDLLDILLFSVSLGVAAVPEGMPAIVTVALALGIQRMAAQNALIRKLPCVETLGSVSVICTDKTGTLTTGKMKVREYWGANTQDLLTAAALCCNAEIDPQDSTKEVGDPTELAILWAAHEKGINKEDLENKNKRVWTHPFEADMKRMSVFREDGKLYLKGALESVLPLCQVSNSHSILEANQKMTSRGLRTLAVARGDSSAEENLHFLGIIGISDPPRKEVPEAIREARKAGILPIMITGDHPVTAKSIAQEIGLLLEGENENDRIYARATPEDKLRLIRDWKKKGAIVAMTGDGVNDAPALKEAHVGIAMGKSGTEVTKQAADLVLADDHFETIISAVREGRGVYQNIRKAVIYLLTGNFAELTVVFGASLIGLPPPFYASHLLWINLVTDSLPALSLVMDPVQSDVMKNTPRSVQEPLLRKTDWIQLISTGFLEALVVSSLFAFLIYSDENLDRSRNFAFSTLVFSQLFRTLGARSQTKTFFRVGFFNNLWLLGVIGISILLQISLHYIPATQKLLNLEPLLLQEWALCLGLALIPISTIEIKKLLRSLAL